MINEPSEIDLRISTRTEFQLLGINGVIAELKKIDNHDLNTQIEVYEDLMQEDNDEMREFIAKSSNIKDMSDVTYPNSLFFFFVIPILIL